MTLSKLRAYKFIGVVILGIILLKVDLYTMVRHLKQIRIDDLLLVLVIAILQIGIRAYRWYRMLWIQGISCPFREAIMFYFSCVFIGLVTPGRIGEAVKAGFLKRQGYTNFSYAMSSVVVDRFLDLYIMLVVALCGLIYLRLSGFIGVCSWIAVTVAVCLPFIFLNRWYVQSLASWVSGRIARRFHKKWAIAMDDFSRGFLDLIHVELTMAIMLTGISYGLFIFQNLLLARSMMGQMDVLTIAFIVSITALAGFVPITVAGLGTREAMFIYLFGWIGKSSEMALGFALLFNFVYLIFLGIVGAAVWFALPAKLKRGPFGKPDTSNDTNQMETP